MSYLDARAREIMARTKVFAVGVILDAGLEDGVIWAEVELRPEGVEVLVEWAPAVRGLYRLPRAGELALVAFPDGDFADGLMLANVPADDLPEAALPDTLEDAVLYLHAPEGETVKIIATGGGHVIVEAERVVVASGDVRLGGEDASDQVVTQNRLNLKFEAFKKVFEAHQHSYIAPLIPGAAAVTTPGAPPQTPAPTLDGSSSTKVKAS